MSFYPWNTITISQFQFVAFLNVFILSFFSSLLFATQTTDTLSFKFHRLKQATREITLVWLTMPSHRPLLCTFSMVSLSLLYPKWRITAWRNYGKLIAFPFHCVFSPLFMCSPCVVKVKILLSYWEIMEWPTAHHRT